MSKVIRLSNKNVQLINQMREIFKDDPTAELLTDDQIIMAALGMWRLQYISKEELKGDN